jgi:AraC family transcriptional regulator of arabinose operon
MSERVPAEGLRVVRAGAELDHDPAYRVDRPHGTDDWLFVQFLTPIVFPDGDGGRALPTGTCILYPPGRPQHYRPPPGQGYRNNWCHFEGGGADALVARCAPPLAIPVIRLPLQPLGRLIAALAQELHQRRPQWADAAAGLLVQALVAFARGVHEQRPDGGDGERQALALRLRELRATVHRRLAEGWTVPRMAGLMHLSSSRFAHLYREIIGASPLDDLLEARIAQAAELLGRPGSLVKSVAMQVGFRDQHHFGKSFRARMGCSPGAYARMQTSGLP